VRSLPSPVRRIVGFAGTIAFGIAVAAVVSTIAGATQAPHQDDQQGGGAALLQSEIRAMEAGGRSADDPKVRLLQDDLDALERGKDVVAPQEPGVDVGATLGAAGDPSARDAADTDRAETAGNAAVAAEDAADASAWDDGAVQCEVVPPDLLTAKDIAGATCTSTLDPDGGSHYSATGPDDVVRTVHFAPDGTITRDPDHHR
jgi:hypothetical protein